MLDIVHRYSIQRDIQIERGAYVLSALEKAF